MGLRRLVRTLPTLSVLWPPLGRGGIFGWHDGHPRQTSPQTQNDALAPTDRRRTWGFRLGAAVALSVPVFALGSAVSIPIPIPSSISMAIPGVRSTVPRAYAQTVGVTPATLSPLTVSHGEIVNAQGQSVLLRGVNVNALVAYSKGHPEATPLTPGQLRLMAAMGFNFIRLPLSLSLLEPKPGLISQAYLAQIADTVARAQAQGMYVLLDLHQDRYAAGLYPGESDGMPSYMVNTLGLGQRPILLGLTDPAVQGAFTAFWKNLRASGKPMQDWYLLGLTALARTFADSPAVAGYDVMNEPNPGLLLTRHFVPGELLPFYAKAVADVRSVSKTQPIFLEPDVVSMALGDPLWPLAKASFVHDGIVFEPHLYAPSTVVQAGHVFNVKGARRAVAKGTLGLLAKAAERQAHHLGVPWLAGEYGAPQGRLGNTEIAQDVSLTDDYAVGSAYWLWGIVPHTYNWNLVHPDGTLAAPLSRLALVASPYPALTGGVLQSLTYRPKTQVLHLAATLSASRGSTVLVWTSLTYPKGAVLKANLPYRLLTATDQVGTVSILRTEAVFAPGSESLNLTLAPNGS